MCRAPTQQSRFRVLSCCRCSTGTEEKREREPWTNRKWRGVKAVGLRGFPRRARATKLSTCKSERRISFLTYQRGYELALCARKKRKYKRENEDWTYTLVPRRKSWIRCVLRTTIQTLQFAPRREQLSATSILVRRNVARCSLRLIYIIHLTDYE